MIVKDITNYLETIAPLSFQESYDNSGLIVGEPNQKVTNVLVCLDSIEEVVDEAIEKNCELIIAHHPIVFSGLKRFNGNSYIEKTIIKAIKNNIAIYACHTNLDNVLENGVNQKIADKLHLQNTHILAPKKNELSKLITYIPNEHLQQVREALFNAGAGNIGNYDNCSFNSNGTGTYKANDKANPFKGEKNELHQEEETKTEVIFPNYLQGKIIHALTQAHPYEEVAYDIIQLKNTFTTVGSGIIGELNQPKNTIEFLKELKTTLNVGVVKYTNPHKSEIKKIAICGGSGSFLLPQAKANNADIFITADYKYHQFFDAENKIIIADIGHYESEQFTIDLFQELLTNQFKDLKIVKTSIITNPVNYL